MMIGGGGIVLFRHHIKKGIRPLFTKEIQKKEVRREPAYPFG